MKVRPILLVLLAIVAIGSAFILGGLYFDSLFSSQIDDSNVETLLNPALNSNIFSLSQSQLQDAIYIAPNTDIQAIVDDAPNGSIFIIQAGIHRLQSITPRDNDILIGEDGAILNGAMVLDNFTFEDTYWVNRDTRLSDFARLVGGVCRTGYERCNHAYDIFIDNQPLQHVNTVDAVTEGTWFFDYEADEIILGTDPNGHLVELSSTFHAFKGEADAVTIQNLTIEKYGGYGQLGAIRAQDTTNWVINNNVVRLNSGAGITFGMGSQVLNNYVFMNGQIGISGEGDNVLIHGNEIVYNNYAQYDPSWEAGGTKFVATNNLIVRNNYVHHNDGAGLWTDIDNFNTLYEYNLVLANNGSGIFHEISYDAVIRNNVVRYNLNEDVEVYFGAQITLSSSGNVEVYSNDVVTGEDGGNAIVILQQARGEGNLGVYEARNNHVYNNRIVFLNTTGEVAAATDIDDTAWFWQENIFEDNAYYGLDNNLALWGWENENINWNAFRRLTNTAGNYSTQIPLHAISPPSWQSLQELSARGAD